MEINFSTFLPSSVRVLSGRDYGKDVRATNNLDKVDRTTEHVRVIIPDKIYSVNASFFLGLLVRAFVYWALTSFEVVMNLFVMKLLMKILKMESKGQLRNLMF